MNKLLNTLICICCFANTLFSQEDYRDTLVGKYIGQQRKTDINQEPVTGWSSFEMWVFKSPHDSDRIFVGPNFYNEQELEQIHRNNFLALDSQTLEYNRPNSKSDFGHFHAGDSLRDMFGTMIAPRTPGYREFKGAHERTVGIAEQRLNTVLLYPNPVRQMLYISGLTQQVYYTVYNLAGSRLQEGSAKDNIAVGHLLPGTYLLELQFGKNRAIRRFIKE